MQKIAFFFDKMTSLECFNYHFVKKTISKPSIPLFTQVLSNKNIKPFNHCFRSERTVKIPVCTFSFVGVSKKAYFTSHYLKNKFSSVSFS